MANKFYSPSEIYEDIKEGSFKYESAGSRAGKKVRDSVKKAVGKAKKIRQNIKNEDIYLKDGSLRSKKVVRKANPMTGELSVVSIDDRPIGSAIKSVIGLKKGGKIPAWQHHVKSKYGK